jgi:glutaredoxin
LDPGGRRPLTSDSDRSIVTLLSESCMPKVTIWLFTTSACPHCNAARLFLDESGADYVERNVLEDPIALQDMLYLTGRSEVPVLYAGYEAAIGFHLARWQGILAHVKELEETGDPFRLPELFGPDPLKL